MAEQDILKIIGGNIKALRQARGISQDLFGLVADIDRSYIGSVERGERNISAKNIVKIAQALGVNPAELFQGVV